MKEEGKEPEKRGKKGKEREKGSKEKKLVFYFYTCSAAEELHIEAARGSRKLARGRRETLKL